MISTKGLVPGDTVYTTKPCGEDFGIPLVRPTRGTVRGVVRTVKSVVGGVVRFTDGTKSPILHGRTAWLEAER